MSDHVSPTPPAAGPSRSAASRRTVLRSAGLIALTGGTAATLGACAADAEPVAPSSAAPSSAAPSPSAAASTPASPSPSAAASSAPPKTSAPAPSGPSVATADVPVGGGVILKDADYVVTQPSKGTYKAFSKICTHQGCPVTEVADGAIECKCHGSKFSIKDGSVQTPPASKSLAESKTTVVGGKVYVND